MSYSVKKVFISINRPELKAIIEENNVCLPGNVKVIFCEVAQASSIVESELCEKLIIIIHFYEKGENENPKDIVEFKKNMQRLNFTNFITIIDEISMLSFMNSIDKILKFFNEKKKA